MKQMTLASGGFEKHGKTTRRAQFLADMNRVVPWSNLCALIEPHYSRGVAGRPPIGVERMLRIYFLQQWFNLSDPAVEESLYDVLSMREFVGIDLGREAAPDETTILRFRHLLEKHELGKRLFEEVGRHLQANGLKLSTGTIVDGLALDSSGNLYVVNDLSQFGGVDTVTVYAPGASGNAAPIRTITGSATGMDGAAFDAVDSSGTLYVTNGYANSVTIYAPGANGNAAPLATIAGSNTNINRPQGIALDSGGNMYVANSGGTSIVVFAAGSNGNVAPIRTIGGSNAGINAPVGIALGL